MTLPCLPVVKIRLGTGASFGNPLVLGDPANGILGTNVLGSAAIQVVDISQQVTRIATRHGRDRMFEEYLPGDATIEFLDFTGDWNPANTSSPYYPNILPMRQVQLYTTYNSTTYFIFSGYITSWDYNWADQSADYATVTIQAVDAFRLLQLANITTVTGAANKDLPGTRINLILDEIDWPAALRDIDMGDTELEGDPGDSRSALAAIQNIEQSDLGAFFIAHDGTAVYYDRARLSEKASGKKITGPVRTNLIPNPSFEVNTTGWSGSAATVARVTTDAFVGSASLQATTTSTSQSAKAKSAAITANPGETFIGSVYIKNTSGTNRQFRPVLEYYNISDGYIGESSVSAGTINVGSGWTRISHSATAPANTAFVRFAVYLQYSNQAINNVTLLDGALVEKSSVLGPYFDGSTSYTPSAPYELINVGWTGTPNNSTSTATPIYFYAPIFDDNGTNIGYQDIDINFDETELANQVTLTRLSGSPQTASDATSISNYFLRSYERSGLMMETNSIALIRAGQILQYRKDPRIRIDSFTLDMSSNTNRVEPGLALEIGDPIILTKNMANGSDLTLRLTIQGHTTDITPESWTTTFSTAYPLSTAFILGSSEFGVLGTNTL